MRSRQPDLTAGRFRKLAQLIAGGLDSRKVTPQFEDSLDCCRRMSFMCIHPSGRHLDLLPQSFSPSNDVDSGPRSREGCHRGGALDPTARIEAVRYQDDHPPTRFPRFKLFCRVAERIEEIPLEAHAIFSVQRTNRLPRIVRPILHQRRFLGILNDRQMIVGREG